MRFEIVAGVLMCNSMHKLSGKEEIWLIEVNNNEFTPSLVMIDSS